MYLQKIIAKSSFPKQCRYDFLEFSTLALSFNTNFTKRVGVSVETSDRRSGEIIGTRNLGKIIGKNFKTEVPKHVPLATPI